MPSCILYSRGTSRIYLRGTQMLRGTSGRTHTAPVVKSWEMHWLLSYCHNLWVTAEIWSEMCRVNRIPKGYWQGLGEGFIIADFIDVLQSCLCGVMCAYVCVCVWAEMGWWMKRGHRNNKNTLEMPQYWYEAPSELLLFSYNFFLVAEKMFLSFQPLHICWLTWHAR